MRSKKHVAAKDPLERGIMDSCWGSVQAVTLSHPSASVQVALLAPDGPEKIPFTSTQPAL
jgi:hypothetical protein